VSDKKGNGIQNASLIGLAVAVLTGGGYIGISESGEDAQIAALLEADKESKLEHKELTKQVNLLEIKLAVLQSEMNFYKTKASIKSHEGTVRVPYLDSLQNPTIAYGHLLSNPLSDRAMECILEDDIHEAMYQLNAYWPNWMDYPEHVQDVLVELAYNMGIKSLLSFKRMKASMDEGSWSDAGMELLDSRYADQVGERAETLATRLTEL